MSYLEAENIEKLAKRIVNLEVVVSELMYRLEQLEPSKYGYCNDCGKELDENGYCSYPCPNCD
tara:strand:- start:199 stop:387 length:189 start_codon:yes stop_codon:yes gene_type:complete